MVDGGAVLHLDLVLKDRIGAQQRADNSMCSRDGSLLGGIVNAIRCSLPSNDTMSRAEQTVAALGGWTVGADYCRSFVLRRLYRGECEGIHISVA